LDANQKHLEVMHSLNRFDVKIVLFCVDGHMNMVLKRNINYIYPPLVLKSNATQSRDS
jgi:small nuclear ribonucleoprotein (snRNP)-like protein